jgi:hypothetical protein
MKYGRKFNFILNSYTFLEIMQGTRHVSLIEVGSGLSERYIRGVTIKFANSPPCACHGSGGQKPQYCLITLENQRVTAVLLLIYGSLFLIGVYYCLSVFWCAVARMSELKLQQGTNEH